MARVHALVGAFAIVVLPAASWIDGSGQLAWTMFSRTGSYRLAIVGWDPNGRAHAIAPSALSRFSGRRAASFFSGADHERMHDVARVTLRRHLAEVATLACRVGHPRRVEVTLWDRAGLDAPERTHVARAACGP